MQKIICYLKWLWKKVVCNEHGTWVAVAVAGVGAAAAAGTSIASYDSARKAAHSQEDAANRGTDVQWAMYKQSREDYAPWREAGGNAVESLARKVAAGPGDFYKSPGYDFRLAEGNKALERSAASRTGALGADTERALIRYNQDYASGEYDNFLARYYQSLTPLQSLSGVGQTATAGTTTAGLNAANQIAAAQQNAGNAQAAGYINSANAITGGIQSLGNNALAGYNAWRQFNNGNSGYAPPTYNVSNAGAMTDYGSGSYFNVDPNLL
jgi:hypothetical protein